MMASFKSISKIRPAAVIAEKLGTGAGIAGGRGSRNVLPAGAIDEEKPL